MHKEILKKCLTDREKYGKIKTEEKKILPVTERSGSAMTQREGTEICHPGRQTQEKIECVRLLVRPGIA